MAANMRMRETLAARAESADIRVRTGIELAASQLLLGQLDLSLLGLFLRFFCT